MGNVNSAISHALDALELGKNVAVLVQILVPERVNGMGTPASSIGTVRLLRATDAIELVKVKGSSKRQRRPQMLAPEKFHEPLAVLREPYRTMAIVAMCTGLRISEIRAQRWEHIDFKAGAMLVQQGVVNGRIGKVKTEASLDEVPLDPAFAETRLN